MELFFPDHESIREDEGRGRSVGFLPPKEFYEKVNIEYADVDEVISLNDDGYTFDEIAEFLEQKYSINTPI